MIKLHFDGALTLTHHATDLVLPGGANITTAAGDEAEFVEYDTGKWRRTNYVRAAGLGNLLKLQNGGAVTLSLAENLVSVPAGVSRITIAFDSVTPSAATTFNLQLGTSGGLATSGYLGVTSLTTTSASTALASSNTYAAIVQNSGQSTTGILNLIKHPGTNKWVINGAGHVGLQNTFTASHVVTLSGTLDRLAIRSSGTPTLSGTATVFWEF